jgi:hypothetical protein
MGILAVLAFFCAVLATPAAALETARAFAASGAPHLALARIEKLQPADTAAPRWAEWETLRLNLLAELKRNEEVLKRVAALPAGLPQPVLRQCLLAAIRAAVAAGRPAAAREYAARLLWQLDPAPDEARDARLLVIESHLAERQGEAAFHSMLRFDQDYRPVGRDIAERFVTGLLDLGLEKEAVNWMAALENTGPLKLRLRLRAGLVAPDAAVVQARARLGGGDVAGYWRVLADAAEKLNDGTLRVEVMERRLQAGGGGNPQPPQAEALWQAYSIEAQVAANLARLLTGDDNAWMDFASRRMGSSPPQARALFAHLSRKGAARDTRLAAQLQLVYSLQQGGLDQAALRLFEAEDSPEALDSRARYLLGGMAESRHLPAMATRYWQGLAAPPGTGDEEWQARRAVMQWRAGMEEAALGTMRDLAGRAKTLPEPATGRAVALAREMRAAGKPAAAESLYIALLPVAGRARERDILLALGEIAESGARFAAAADYFLRAALADEPRATDAKALQARLAAAANLARAGHDEDARAQYRWLLKHSKDPAQVEAARRELARPWPFVNREP